MDTTKEMRAGRLPLSPTLRSRPIATQRLSAARCRALADHMCQLVWIADGEGRPVWFNRRWYEHTGASSADMEGASWRSILAIGRDITKSKQEEAELRVGEERFGVLADSTPNVVWTADREGHVDYWNQRAVEYFGLPFQAEHGAWDRVVHRDDLTRMTEAWRDAFREQREFSFEYRIRRTDGVYRWHLCRAVPLLDGEGRLAKWLGSNMDIGEQKEVEHAFEQRVEARTQELEHRKGELRESNGDIDQFVHLASLAWKIEANQAEVQVMDLPRIRVRPRQFEQIFHHLIENALKYRIADTPPRIVIRAWPHGERWVFSIKDNGIGADPHLRVGIFQIFQRVHAREDRKGSGVGLAVCRKIVEFHCGRIWLDRSPEGGADFRFDLPGGV